MPIFIFVYRCIDVAISLEGKYSKLIGVMTSGEQRGD